MALEVAEGLTASPQMRTRVKAAAQRFAITLTAWLYGDRKRLEVAPVTPELQRELDRDPPAYIPNDQRNSGQGRVQDKRR